MGGILSRVETQWLSRGQIGLSKIGKGKRPMDKVEYINSAQHTYIQQTLSIHKHSPSFLQMQYASMCHSLTGRPLSSNFNAG